MGTCLYSIIRIGCKYSVLWKEYKEKQLNSERKRTAPNALKGGHAY
ncbi:MAG: hypothetical protein PHC45_08845 [Clostridiaceae bacterium]|nr:hypothetical protein [Clostridiaceae bacterium]